MNAKEKKIDSHVPLDDAMQFVRRPDVQTLYIDNILFSARTDGTLITTGIQKIPGGMEIEQLRFIVSERLARRCLDSLANLLDYYPEKKQSKA